MSTSTYRVTGMTCEHCVNAVRIEIAALDGVTDVAVDLAPGGTSAITVTSSEPLSAVQIGDALDEAGEYRLVD